MIGQTCSIYPNLLVPNFGPGLHTAVSFHIFLHLKIDFSALRRNLQHPHCEYWLLFDWFNLFHPTLFANFGPGLRDRWEHQNGWILGKIPNSLWHPPPSFSENHVADFATKVRTFMTKVRMFIIVGLLCIIWSYFPWYTINM